MSFLLPTRHERAAALFWPRDSGGTASIDYETRAVYSCLKRVNHSGGFAPVQ
jgi:hypothetical protein